MPDRPDIQAIAARAAAAVRVVRDAGTAVRHGMVRQGFSGDGVSMGEALDYAEEAIAAAEAWRRVL